MAPTPPQYSPIKPIEVSSRWFPKGQSFGLYEAGGYVAPNVTSILSHAFPFDRSKWVEAEPGIDHDAVARESAERGTAVHLAMEKWLMGESSQYNPELAPWVEPLRGLMARATATLAVEIPVHHVIPGIGRYAGSCDGLMLVRDEVVIVDYKTKRPGKNISARFCDKQRTQLAAYALAINALYRDQLPGPVSRTSLLFAHPDEGRKPTVISTSGEELLAFQDRWTEILSEWFDLHGDAVAKEQSAFAKRSRAAAT